MPDAGKGEQHRGETQSPEHYLNYLPPVLWRGRPAASELSLGTMLRIFEKILTGIPNGCSLPHDPDRSDGRRLHEHRSITAEIAQLQALRPLDDTREVPAVAASWVALDFPTLQDARCGTSTSGARSPRRSRRSTGCAAQGRAEQVPGPVRHRPARPRVALDDGTRLLTVVPPRHGAPPVTALVSEGPVVNGNGVALEGITGLVCVAVDGGPGCSSATPVCQRGTRAVKSRVWATGRLRPVRNLRRPARRHPRAEQDEPHQSRRPHGAAGAGPPTGDGVRPGPAGGLFAVPAPFRGTTATSAAG